MAASAAPAQEREFGLSSPEILVESGFLRFLLPRFSLKTGIRIEQLPNGADVTFSTQSGEPFMEGLDTVFYLRTHTTGQNRARNAERFVDWLFSETGQRTIEQYTLNGVAPFSAIEAKPIPEPELVFIGDPARGEAFSYTNCGRCHVVGQRNRMKGIGSTPSFRLLRGLPDWHERFSTFYVRIPHPSMTQVEDITLPFSPSRPPAHYPLRLNQSQLEDILSFVYTLEPADLGAPLVIHQ